MPEKILIVDDEIDTLRLVGMMLESKGYQIIAASNGQKAISIAHSEHPALILLDIMMPGMDGYEVTRQLQQSEETSQIPIIIFTAKTGMDSKVLGLELGADAYLTKPISTRELLAHVKSVLGRSSKTDYQSPMRERAHLIAVIAPKGGMGATTVALNLGVALQKQTQQAIIVAEYRPGQGSLSLELGYGKPEGLNRLLQMNPGDVTLRSVENELVNHNSGIRLLMSSPQPRDAAYCGVVGNFEAITRCLAQLADVVILDVGPGLTAVNETVLGLCHQVLAIVEPLPKSVIQTKALIQDLNSIGIGEGQVDVIMVNRVRSSLQLTMSQVQEQLGNKVSIAFTPDPELAYQASSKNAPMILLMPEGLAARQFEKLAGRISERVT